MKVALDIDGVVYDFNRAWKQIAWEKYGQKFPLQQYEWYPNDPDNILGKIMSEPEVWQIGEPYPLVPSKLRALAFGDDIRFFAVSAVPPKYADLRREWLRKYSIPVEELLVCDGPYAKCTTASRFGMTVSVDDNTDNAAAYARTGLHSFLMSRGWNRTFTHDGVERVTWDTLPKRLRELNAVTD